MKTEDEKSFYMVYVAGRNGPGKSHDTHVEAHAEARRLSGLHLNQRVYILKALEYLISEIPLPTRVGLKD
jgi:hypothetical protein